MRKLSTFLPRKIRENPTWSAFADAVEQAFNKNVINPSLEIINLRNPREIEAYFLPRLQELLGCSVKTDFFSEQTQREIIAALYEYYTKSGTKYLSRFLSLATGYVTKLEAFWTEDYEDFYDKPLGTTIYEDPENGTWFFTPHYGVFIDGFLTYKASNVRTYTGMLGMRNSKCGYLYLGYPEFTEADFEDLYNNELLIELFYEFAPVHLVLERVIREYILQANLYFVGAVHQKVIYPTGDTLPWSGFNGAISEFIKHL